MKKLLLAMLIAGLSTGCGIDYLGSTKIIFEGRVTGPDGTPLEGIKVNTTISDGYYSDEISYDFTDSNGNYRMIFPKAAEKVDVWVSINPTDAENNFSTTQIFNIGLDQVNDYKIDFGTQSIYEIEHPVTLHLNFTNNIPLKIELIGMVNNNRVDYNFDVLPDNPEYEYFSDFFVEASQILSLRMLQADGSTREVQIPVGEQDLTYTVQ